MSDDSLREIERRLLEEGNADLVRWVCGMLLAAQTQNVTVHETPIEQDAPLWESFVLSASGCHTTSIYVPRDFGFLLMGISIIAAPDSTEIGRFCSSANAALCVNPQGETFEFPASLLTVTRNGLADRPGMPALRMPQRIVHRACNLTLEIRNAVTFSPIAMTVAFHGRRLRTYERAGVAPT